MEVEAVSKNLFQAVAASITGALSFLYGWVIRNTSRANKLEQMMAANIEGDRQRDRDIAELKKEFAELKGAIYKWRQEQVNLNAKINKVLDALGE